MVPAMSAEEVAEHIKRVDRLVLKGTEVPAEDLTVDIAGLYTRYKWGGPGLTPLPGAAVTRLGLVEKTTDARWLRHFDGHARHVGVYRSAIGYYWLLRYDPELKHHHLDHAGTAADINDKYGTS